MVQELDKKPKLTRYKAEKAKFCTKCGAKREQEGQEICEVCGSEFKFRFETI